DAGGRRARGNRRNRVRAAGSPAQLARGEWRGGGGHGTGDPAAAALARHGSGGGRPRRHTAQPDEPRRLGELRRRRGTDHARAAERRANVRRAADRGSARSRGRASGGVFTRLLVGVDGSPRADSAFEQAVVLAQRFGSTVVVAYVREGGGRAADGAAMLDRARERLVAAGLKAELAEREGEPDVALAELAKPADAVLVGRRGVTTKGDALGPTASSLIRIAERCVIVCGGLPSPMTSCALAFDG